MLLAINYLLPTMARLLKTEMSIVLIFDCVKLHRNTLIVRFS